MSIDFDTDKDVEALLKLEEVTRLEAYMNRKKQSRIEKRPPISKRPHGVACTSEVGTYFRWFSSNAKAHDCLVALGSGKEINPRHCYRELDGTVTYVK
jgi:hypothetical protein